MPKILTFEMRQDDPGKCTSAKMRRLGFARRVSRGGISRNAIVLNPTANELVSRSDKQFIEKGGIVVIDCSWKKAGDVFDARFNGQQRKLPALLAGNPTNYAKIGSLSSLEAVSACLYITGFKKQAEKLMSIYKWGDTFLTLNHEPLEEYSKSESQEEIKEAEISFFPILSS